MTVWQGVRKGPRGEGDTAHNSSHVVFMFKLFFQKGALTHRSVALVSLTDWLVPFALAGQVGAHEPQQEGHL